MRNPIFTAAFAAIFIASMAVASAALQSGSLLNGTINQNLSSNHAYVGQPVSLSNVTSDDGSGSVVGGTLYGSVTSVQKAGQGRRGQIAMVFTRLVTRSGATYAVNTTVTKTATSTKNNTLKEVGGAVGGMLVGNMLGKVLFHTGGGGIVGAAGGFLLAKNNNSDINIPAGSAVQVQINSIVRRQSH